jgi:hypothetical protein
MENTDLNLQRIIQALCQPTNEIVESILISLITK